MARPDSPASLGTFTAGPSAGETLSTFWSWWTNRLAECVPAPIRAWVAGREQTVVIEWERDGLSLKRVGVSGQVSSAIARVPLDVGAHPKPESFSTALKTLAARTRGAVTLAVGEDRTLRKSLKLPLAARENLRTVVGYDIDRLTPFPAGSVLFDAVERSVDHAGRSVQADFIATPRAPVDALIAATQRAGLSVARVVPTAQEAASPLNMLRAAEGAPQRRWFANPHLWLAATTAALVGAVIAFPLWHKREQIIAAQPTMALAERDAQETDKLLRELQQRVSQYNFLPAKRHTTALTVQVLDEVTKLLPDDTWVQNFEMKTVRSTTANASGGTTNIAARELQLQGESGSSAKLIPTFENAALFGAPQFKSPLTKLNYPGQNVNGDRFHIAMEVKGAPLPAVVPITAQVVAGPVSPSASPAASPAPTAPAGAAKSARTGANVPTAQASAPASAPASPMAPSATEVKK
jgi:general secretion pathway protein L